jgi:hypothetical protein
VQSVSGQVQYRVIFRIQSTMTKAKLNRLIKRGSIEPEKVRNYKAPMFSLKAASDALNLGAGKAKLLLVFTGSHRSTLNSLVSTKTGPFFGCHVQEFPALDRAFAQAITAELNSKPDSANLLDSARAWDAFCMLDKWPEELQQALKTVLFATAKDDETKPVRLNDFILKAARARPEELFKELLATFHSLTLPQTAVLVEIFKTKERFSPYSEQALAQYKERSAQITHCGNPGLYSFFARLFSK